MLSQFTMHATKYELLIVSVVLDFASFFRLHHVFVVKFPILNLTKYSMAKVSVDVRT